MKDKETMRLEVDHIPTRQELIDKCFDKFKEPIKNIEHAEGAYRMGDDKLCESYLQDAEWDIEEIRVLVGGSNG